MDTPSTISASRLHTLVRRVVRRVAQLQLSQTAANLAFLSLLALVPIFTIAVSLLGATPMFASLRESLLRFLSANFFLPSFSETVVRYLNQFAAKASQLSLLGGLVFFATAFTVLLTLDRALNRIWQVRRPRPLARRLTLYWTFLSLGPLLLAATLTVNGLVASELFGGTRLHGAQRLWLAMVPAFAAIGGLTLLYRLVPNAPVRWRDAFIGALLASLALDLAQRLLGLQVARLPTYTIVYGAFAALPLFLVWLFLVWMIVLSAAVLTASLPSWGLAESDASADSPAARFAQARAVIDALRAAHARGRPGLQVLDFRPLFAADPQAADAMGRRLSELGYLERYWRIGAARADQQNAPQDASGSSLASTPQRMRWWSAGGRAAPVWQEVWLPAPGFSAMCLRPLFDACWQAPLAAQSDPPAHARPPIGKASGAWITSTDLDQPLALLPPGHTDPAPS